MHVLSAAELLQVWEWGQNRHPVDRALALLVAAYPEQSWDELTQLSLSARDRHLFDLRESLFGTHLTGFASCPACDQKLEFTLQTPQLSKSTSLATPHRLQSGGFDISYRLPNSLDMAQLAQMKDLAAAQKTLLQLIIRRVQRDGQEFPVADLPQEISAALQSQLLADDPMLEIDLELTCLSCSHVWHALLDIADFLWAEICAYVERLMREVHILALSYGWSETEILAMSELRRGKYLELVLA